MLLFSKPCSSLPERFLRQKTTSVDTTGSAMSAKLPWVEQSHNKLITAIDYARTDQEDGCVSSLALQLPRQLNNELHKTSHLSLLF